MNAEHQESSGGQLSIFIRLGIPPRPLQATIAVPTQANMVEGPPRKNVVFTLQLYSWYGTPAVQDKGIPGAAELLIQSFLPPRAAAQVAHPMSWMVPTGATNLAIAPPEDGTALASQHKFPGAEGSGRTSPATCSRYQAPMDVLIFHPPDQPLRRPLPPT